jgi:hypothetical protein
MPHTSLSPSADKKVALLVKPGTVSGSEPSRFSQQQYLSAPINTKEHPIKYNAEKSA